RTDGNDRAAGRSARAGADTPAHPRVARRRAARDARRRGPGSGRGHARRRGARDHAVAWLRAYYALPRQYGRDSVDERRGAACARRRRAARRLQPLPPASRGRRRPGPARRLAAAAADAGARIRAARADDRHLPLLLRAHARAEVGAVRAAAAARQALGHALPRLRHSRQAAGGARMVGTRRRARGRLVRRRALGAGRTCDPAGDRRALDRAGTAVGSRATRRAARAVVARAQGDGARRRGVRGARRRARDRRGARPPRGVRALSPRGRRRRPAERRLVRRVRDRVARTRQARRHVPARRGGAPHRGGVRRLGADRERDEGDARGAAAAVGGVGGGASAGRCGEPRVRRGGSRPRADDRPPARALRWAHMKLGAELRRLGRHSAIYGLGGLVSRILATLLLPLYTHYLPPRAYGRVEIVTATTAVAAIALQMGISSAFFRFYFDEKEEARKLTVIRTS